VARITVEDCLKRVPNRFQLVNMVAKRVRQIREGSEYLVRSPKNEDIVVALREIAAGRLTVKEGGQPEAEELIEAAAEQIEPAVEPETAGEDTEPPQESATE